MITLRISCTEIEVVTGIGWEISRKRGKRDEPSRPKERAVVLQSTNLVRHVVPFIDCESFRLMLHRAMTTRFVPKAAMISRSTSNGLSQL